MADLFTHSADTAHTAMVAGFEPPPACPYLALYSCGLANSFTFRNQPSPIARGLGVHAPRDCPCHSCRSRAARMPHETVTVAPPRLRSSL